MSKFESFCRNIHKNKHGYVPDLLDLENDGFRDLAMAAFLSDMSNEMAGEIYLNLSCKEKNIVYQYNEIKCQDAIDAYNQRIDDAKNIELMDDHTFISLVDPEYKWQRFNQAEIDAGFSGTGREFC